MINSYSDSQSRRGTIYRALLPFALGAISAHSASLRPVLFSVPSVLETPAHQQQTLLSAKIEMTA
jgi:hypothetical protein